MQQSQRTQNIPVRRTEKVVRQEIQEEQQIPIETRTHQYTSYVYNSQNRVINPRIETNRTTNFNLNRDLNRQAAVNTAVKNQIRVQAPTREYNYDSNINQSQDRSSREGRVYHYGPTTRREYQGRHVTNREQRGRIVSSVDTTAQNERGGNVQVRQIEHENYPNRIYVSGSGSPGMRRYTNNIQQEEYHSYTRGGIVKFKRWKYTTQTEINKIIMIQRWWRYMLLIRKEQLQSQTSESSEQRNENLVGYEENERYGRRGYRYDYGEEAQFRTETKLRRNQKEKIIAGTKNRYIVETTTIEVFKNQNTILKKVEPEELTKETKKIKRKTIKEQMLEIWDRQNVEYNTESLSILPSEEYISTKTTQIIEEYEYQMQELRTFANKKEEEIVELTQKLESMKTFHKLDLDYVELEFLSKKPTWNEIVKEKKEGKVNIRGKTKIFTEIEILEMLYKIRKPSQISYESEVEYIPKKILRAKPKNIIQKKDRINLMSLPKKPFLIQCVDEHEIIGYKKPQIENVVEERDSLVISSMEKEPLQTEYLDELFIERITKPDNEIQIVDQMEILKTEKPDNEIEFIDSVEILGTKTWATKPSKTYEMTILRTEKPENKVELTNEVVILGEEKPENKVEYTNEII